MHTLFTRRGPFLINSVNKYIHGHTHPNVRRKVQGGRVQPVKTNFIRKGRGAQYYKNTANRAPTNCPKDQDSPKMRLEHPLLQGDAGNTQGTPTGMSLPRPRRSSPLRGWHTMLGRYSSPHDPNRRGSSRLRISRRGTISFSSGHTAVKTHPVWKPAPLFPHSEPSDLLGTALLCSRAEQPQYIGGLRCLRDE